MTRLAASTTPAPATTIRLPAVSFPKIRSRPPIHIPMPPTTPSTTSMSGAKDHWWNSPCCRLTPSATPTVLRVWQVPSRRRHSRPRCLRWLGPGLPPIRSQRRWPSVWASASLRAPRTPLAAEEAGARPPSVLQQIASQGGPSKRRLLQSCPSTASPLLTSNVGSGRDWVQG